MGCNCGKPKCDGKCGISPAVLQINNPSECVIFHKVDVPASMGDSTTNPPKTGAYKNVLLYYEADQTSWLYSSDGIPVRLTNGITNYEDAINLPQINGETLIGDKSSADLKLADAPMVVTIASGNTVWSGADTAEDIYNFFLNQGKVNVIFEGSENYGYEIVSAAYIPGEQKMMCMTTVASVDTGSSPVEFSGNALYGLMTFYTAGKAVDVGELDLQPKLSITDFTGLNMTDGYILEGVPATGASIGMVKPGDGLSISSDGTLSVNTEVTHTFDTVADMKASTVLKAGDVAQTLGFHASNDGGAAIYKITGSGAADEKAVIAVGDLFANIAPDKIVSPEQYGAYGDGTHDDTGSWQLAVDSGRAVLAKPTTYLCGKIGVTENISIDCNHAKFICNADTLFEIKGEVATTLTSQTNYAANSQNYVIADGSYSSYTGYAILKGDNNFQESRDYYKGGFVAEFKSGKMNGSYPIPVTNTSIDIVTPITGELKNIDGLTHTSPSITTVSINVIYGLGYKISNIKENASSCYKFIQLSYCMNCICDNLTVMHHFESSNNNSYIVDFDNASFCSVINSTLHNDLWHCITTGGYYLCYANLVQNCHLTSNDQYAYLDHDNARGTTVKDSTVQCVGVAGLGTVDNVIVMANNDAYKRCIIRVCPVSDRANAIYKFRNCHLITEGANNNYCGVKLQNSPQVSGKTYYVEKVVIENLTAEGGTTPSLSFLTDADSFCVIQDINVSNSMLNCSLKPTSHTYEDVSNAVLTIENCNYQYGSHFINVGAAGYEYNRVVISNSKVWRIFGTITTLELNNVTLEATLTAVNTSITNLYATGLKTFFREDLLLAATNLMISDMYHNANDKWFNICNDATKKYYSHVVGGTMTTVEVTYP